MFLEQKHAQPLVQGADQSGQLDDSAITKHLFCSDFNGIETIFSDHWEQEAETDDGCDGIATQKGIDESVRIVDVKDE